MFSNYKSFELQRENDNLYHDKLLKIENNVFNSSSYYIIKVKIYIHTYIHRYIHRINSNIILKNRQNHFKLKWFFIGKIILI